MQALSPSDKLLRKISRLFDTHLREEFISPSDHLPERIPEDQRIRAARQIMLDVHFYQPLFIAKIKSEGFEAVQ